MLLWDIIKGKKPMKDLFTVARIHNSIIGILAFGFIASAINAQFADSTNAFVVICAAAIGGVVEINPPT